MKKRETTITAANISLAFLISAFHGTAATEIREPTKLAHTSQLRNHEYYKTELQKLEESTRRIHEEVDRILAEFRENIEEYRKHTRGTSGTITTLHSERQEGLAESEQEKAVDDAFKSKTMGEWEKEIGVGVIRNTSEVGIKNMIRLNEILGRKLTKTTVSLDELGKFWGGLGKFLESNYSPTNIRFFFSMAEQYFETKSQLQVLLKGAEEPTPGQILEAIRQKKDLGIDQNLVEINEGMYLKKLGIVYPSKNQIEESFRLRRIGIQNPSEVQIAASLLFEGDTEDEINENVKQYSLIREYLKKLIKEPKSVQISKVYVMTLFLNRLPTAVEFSIMEDPYLLNNGSFISLQMVSKAMLSLEEFGIQDYTIDLFKIMIDFLRDEGRVPAKEVLQKKWIRTTLNMDISDEELEKINNAKIDAFSQKNQFDRSQERIEFIGSIKELLKKPKTTN